MGELTQAPERVLGAPVRLQLPPLLLLPLWVPTDEVGPDPTPDLREGECECWGGPTSPRDLRGNG